MHVDLLQSWGQDTVVLLDLGTLIGLNTYLSTVLGLEAVVYEGLGTILGLGAYRPSIWISNRCNRTVLVQSDSDIS